MKKFFTQVLTAIGFAIIIIGAIIRGNNDMILTLFSTPIIAATLATVFVFAKNTTVKNAGYAISALVGVYGLISVLSDIYSIGMLIISIGMLLMLIPTVIYAIIEFFSWLGFTRKNATTTNVNDLASVLNQYKALETEKILSAEEFEELKSRTLKGTNTDTSSVEDLKKWKKLLDQQIITDEEFSNLKSRVFNK